jgi:hypothetical protein
VIEQGTGVVSTIWHVARHLAPMMHRSLPVRRPIVNTGFVRDHGTAGVGY